MAVEHPDFLSISMGISLEGEWGKDTEDEEEHKKYCNRSVVGGGSDGLRESITQ